LAVLLVPALAATAQAQTAEWRFRWQPGQVLQYRVEHTTAVSEVAGGNKVETKSKVNLVKRWQVVAVDAQGTATVQMSIVAMRNEQTRPGGEVLLYDSAAPDKSTPELKVAMEKFLGQVLAVLRVDALGRVVEVKQGVASRYEAEPPFVLTLPAATVGAGQGWERGFTITLDPPLGTGEKHAATQKYTCAKVDGALATVSVKTALVQTPATKAEMLPLLQKLADGEVVFDLQRGRVAAARLVIDQTVQGHQGEGSSYRLQSTYTEQIAE
jgi:hypothetical protein